MFSVRRIGVDEGPLLREMRLAALADAPGEATTTLARARAHPDSHWAESASANASGPMQATFFAEPVDAGLDGPALSERRPVVGMVGAYANRHGVVNVVGLWAAPGYRDMGVAPALLEAVARWADESGASRLRLWVVERNEYTRRFYEHEGFRPTGASMPYQLDPRLDQVEMARAV